MRAARLGGASTRRRGRDPPLPQRACTRSGGDQPSGSFGCCQRRAESPRARHHSRRGAPTPQPPPPPDARRRRLARALSNERWAPRRCGRPALGEMRGTMRVGSGLALLGESRDERRRAGARPPWGDRWREKPEKSLPPLLLLLVLLLFPSGSPAHQSARLSATDETPWAASYPRSIARARLTRAPGGRGRKNEASDPNMESRKARERRKGRGRGETGWFASPFHSSSFFLKRLPSSSSLLSDPRKRESIGTHP